MFFRTHQNILDVNLKAKFSLLKTLLVQSKIKYLEQVKYRVVQWGVIEFTILCNHWSLVLMAEHLEWTSMSLLKYASSPHSNPLSTYVKEILSPSTKTTVTELLINRFCQLIISSHITIYWIIGEWQSLRIIMLGLAKAQEWELSVTKKVIIGRLVAQASCKYASARTYSAVSTWCSLHKKATSRNA